MKGLKGRKKGSYWGGRGKFCQSKGTPPNDKINIRQEEGGWKNGNEVWGDTSLEYIHDLFEKSIPGNFHPRKGTQTRRGILLGVSSDTALVQAWKGQ